MITVGVSELRQQAGELIRIVRETGKEVQITYRGDVVALLIPVSSPKARDMIWAKLDDLAAEIRSTPYMALIFRKRAVFR